jgi:hypothetical protein
MSELPISELSKKQVDHELASYIASAGPDERRVLLFICRRFIGIGQRDFGALDLRGELRDGFQETAEEAADGLFYMSLWFLVQQINRPMVPVAADTEPGQMERPSKPIEPTPLGRPCEVCDGPGPVLYDDKPGAKNFARYCCVSCHSTPQDTFFTRRRSLGPVVLASDGPARYRNEAGQLVEDDDVPDEDWPR